MILKNKKIHYQETRTNPFKNFYSNFTLQKEQDVIFHKNSELQTKKYTHGITFPTKKMPPNLKRKTI